MRVFLVRPERLVLAWSALWPLLEPAARRTRDLPEARVRQLVDGGEAQLWAIIENGRPIAAVTTQITLEPEKRCRLWLVGGSRLDEWAPTFLAALEPWARALGCVALWGAKSRAGWARIVRLFGGEEIKTADGNAAWARRI